MKKQISVIIQYEQPCAGRPIRKADDAMKDSRKEILILMADDDDDDYLVISEAVHEVGLPCSLFRVRNGEELMDYLLGCGKYSDTMLFPRPGLILLDLNMPRMDGRLALSEIKARSDLSRIPVIVMSASEADEDIASSYAEGAASFIKKPDESKKIVQMVRELGQYWLGTVKLPNWY